MELDRFDKQILEILSNEDINLNELSERINLSVSSVHRRIKHLIDNAIMTKVKRDINYQKLGFSLKRIGKIEHVVALHSSFVIKEYNVFNCSGLLSKV